MSRGELVQLRHVLQIHAVVTGHIGGDIQLAHAAAHQGVLAAENIFGEERVLDARAVPTCIYTIPELATIGQTAQSAEEEVAVG